MGQLGYCKGSSVVPPTPCLTRITVAGRVGDACWLKADSKDIMGIWVQFTWKRWTGG